MTNTETIDRLSATIAKLRERVWSVQIEREKLRTLFERVALSICHEGTDIEFDDWQEEAERLGLIVLVPASDDFREKWDAEEMFTWAWSKAAIDAAMRETESDG